MEKGICTQAYIPMRKEPSGASEMVSQLLFGEDYNILHKENGWAFVETIFDSYQGWIANNCVFMLNEDLLKTGCTNYTIVSNPFTLVSEVNSGKAFFISAGSVLYLYAYPNFKIANIEFKCEKLWYETEIFENNKIATMAMGLLNVPYLWGGRSVFGIDCSGLVQICFRHGGINLPRDAYQQAERGTKIACLGDAKMADVAFFVNDMGAISHTGILLNNSQIIHASGRVRIDKIDENGIVNSETEEYTHKLHSIKRLIA